MKIYDILGREVATLIDEHRPAGFHSFDWDAAGYPSGIYFYRLTGEGSVLTKACVLLK